MNVYCFVKPTVIIEDALGFLFRGCRNEGSYKYVHYSHQQDNE